MKEQMLTKQRRNTGITLIALVITIIVLLILAGISIATLTGDNGILTKANEAKTATEIADIKERVQTDILGVQADNKSGDITKGQLVEILEKYFNEVPKAEELSDDLTTVTLETKAEYGSHTIKISDIWNGNFGEETNKKTLAEDLLKTDATATEAASKSPYVKYNGLDCRVLYNDETHGIQIITAGSVGDVALGYDDEVDASDFMYDGTANIDDNFKKAAVSYNNAVDTLNSKAKNYMDKKGIATDARCLGSISTLNSNSKFQGDTSEMWSGIYDYLTKYKWNEKFKNEDTNYSDDVKQLKNLGLNVSSGYTWLASRRVISYSNITSFFMRYADSSSYTQGTLCGVFPGGSVYVSDGTDTEDVSSPRFGFRPVFLIPSNVIISSGDGSSENPYVIE